MLSCKVPPKSSGGQNLIKNHCTGRGRCLIKDLGAMLSCNSLAWQAGGIISDHDFIYFEQLISQVWASTGVQPPALTVVCMDSTT